jgi:hypothetical protein
MTLRKIVINIISLVIIIAPFTVFAVVGENENKGLVPKCGVFSGGVIDNPCEFDDLMQLLNNVINYLLFIIATPLAALIIVYAGVLYVFDGGSAEQVKKAKGILKNVVIGYVIALAAWLIVKTILVALNFEGGKDFINY